MKPRSPVSRTTRGRRRRRARASVSTNAVLTTRSDLRRAPRCVLVVRHRQVVPLDLALHVRDALAERRAGDQDVRRAVGGVEPVDDARQRRRRSWPSTSCTSQPKARQRSAERRQVEHVARVPERLLAVDVDDRRRGSRADGGRRTSPPPRATPRCTRRRSAGTKTRRAEPWRRAASAAPAPSERPCPSEPVEKSTPRSACSGCTPSRLSVGAVGLELARRRASRVRRSAA